MKSILAALLLTAASATAFAQASPVGLWKTIDDETKQEKSLVRITDNGGVFTGKVEKVANPDKQDAKCDKCTDARKDQKILGMTIIEGVKKAANEDYWDGGTILDPNKGETYKVRMTLIDSGKKLEVRGYVGMPLLGRTQTWIRVE